MGVRRWSFQAAAAILTRIPGAGSTGRLASINTRAETSQMQVAQDTPSHTESQNGMRLYLLDAMALAYRAHFIFISRPLINSKGKNTSAAYGFTTALLKLMEDHTMEHVAVVFDALGPEGTFRDALYDDYKANREPMPDDLAENLPYIKSIVRALDIPVLEIPGVEADDVIGTLARRADADGAEVVIVSPDKDFQQLLTERISQFRPAYRGEEFDPITLESFREKYGVEPLQFIDILALMGDASDNVPGVPGIGKKTAPDLIQKYGSIENLLEHAEELSGKRVREGLMENRQAALLSKELVTIKTNVDVDLDWKKCLRRQPDRVAMESIFRDLEFDSLLQRIEARDPLLKGSAGEKSDGPGQTDLFVAGSADAASVSAESDIARYDESLVTYEVVRDRANLNRLARSLEAAPRIAFDTETTATDQMMASLVGLSFSTEKGTAWYVPTPMPDGTSTEAVLEALRPALQNDVPKIGQNVKYDYVVLYRHGLEVKGPLFDTMVAHYLIEPEGQHGLDLLARKYLSYQMIPITELIGTGRTQKSMRDVSVDDVGCYSCEDADVTLQLAEIIEPELARTGVRQVATEIEFPLIRVLADMEMDGIHVDPSLLKEISTYLETEIAGLERQIFEMCGDPFNIGSPQQLGEVLFDRLCLRVVAKTSKGMPSTRESVLRELATEHPLPGLILDWRQLSKLKSTYVDSLGELIHPETGRIHTNFNQTVAATGRLSSTGPNLQNIPVRTEMGREIRKAFVPRPGWRLLSADYVQIELRILASMSGDDALREAFEAGEDVHTSTAARVFGIPIDEVSADQRRKAKEVNYGIPYGVSGWGLAQRLRTSVKEAQDLIDQYQRSYPGVARFLALQVDEARQKGYVETLMGRRRYVPNINARNRMERSFAERVAVNMPIQGTQADMIKIAMIRIHERLARESYASRMLLQVHDELVFECPPEEVDAVRELVRDEMISALPLKVPIEVDAGVGDNWLDAH